MPVPIAAVYGAVQLGIAITNMIVGAVKARKEEKLEIWNNIMSSPGIKEGYEKSWEGLVRETARRYDLQEQYLDLQSDIDQTEQYIENQLIPIDQTSNGTAINIGGEDQLEVLQLELSQLIAERDSYQNKIDNAVGVYTRVHVYEEYWPKIEALKPRIQELQKSISDLEASLSGVNPEDVELLASQQKKLSDLQAQKRYLQSHINNASSFERPYLEESLRPRLNQLNTEINKTNVVIDNLELSIAEQREAREKAPPPDEVPGDTPGEAVIISRVENGEEKFYKIKKPPPNNTRNVIYAIAIGSVVGGGVAYLRKKL